MLMVSQSDQQAKTIITVYPGQKKAGHGGFNADGARYAYLHRQDWRECASRSGALIRASIFFASTWKIQKRDQRKKSFQPKALVSPCM
jgi:hypothetical protein